MLPDVGEPAVIRAALLAFALALVVLVPAAVAALTRGDQAPQTPQNHIVRAGDTIQVAGAGLGCSVTRRGGRATLECRVSKDRAETYGTFLTARRATVARFVSTDAAQIIFTARHRGGWKTCGGASRSSARAAATAAGRQGCR